MSETSETFACPNGCTEGTRKRVPSGPAYNRRPPKLILCTNCGEVFDANPDPENDPRRGHTRDPRQNRPL